MGLSKLKKNFLYAFLSQGIALMISIIVSLIVPKILGVEDFGYYQLFIFYANYVGFTLFGLNDGIYLRFGGKNKSELDKSLLSSQLIVSSLIQLIFIIIASLFIFMMNIDSNRQLVLFCTLFYMLLNNISGYIGFIFQTVNDTQLYSKSIIIEKIVFLISIIVLILLKFSNFEYFIYIYIIGKLGCTIYCLVLGKDYIFCKSAKLPNTIKEMSINISVGIKLMLANIASMLILGVGRFIIDVRWGIESFSKISFLLSIVSFILVFINQFSMVLFPQLRKFDEQDQKKMFLKMYLGMLVLFPSVLFLYKPLTWLISIWLPSYSDSSIYLIFLLPFCAFESKMSLIFSTYLKVFRKEKELLLINMLSSFLCMFLCIVSAFLINSLTAVIVSIVISVSIRVYLSEFFLTKLINLHLTMFMLKEQFFVIIFILLFFFVSSSYTILIFGILYLFYIINLWHTSKALRKQI